jgi:anti-sigma regulatory factor (Ser/Thr protein kinase)
MQDTRVSLLEGKGEDLVSKRRSAAPYKDRRVHVAITIDPDEARFVIRDQGEGFNPASVPAAGQPGSLDPQTGRGLVLMRAFFDEVTFNGSGNEATLVKRRELQAA